jgi:hypothetical protein
MDRASPEFQELLQEGKEATERAREGNIDGTAFGPKRRRLCKDRLRNAALSIVNASLNEHEERVVAISSLLESAAASDQPLADTVRTARMLDREINRRDRVQGIENQEALATYSKQNTTQQLAEMCGETPLPAQISAGMSAIGSQLGVTFFDLHSDTTADQAGQIYQWMQGTPKYLCNLHHALDKQWCHLHRLLPERPDLQQRAGSEKEIPRRCWQEGTCVCGNSHNGNAIWKLRNKFITLVKKTFPAKEDNRKLLVQSKIVARFVPSSTIDADMDGGDLALFYGWEEKFFHLSEVMLSPWTFELQDMYIATDEERILANAADNELCLKVSPSFVSVAIEDT